MRSTVGSPSFNLSNDGSDNFVLYAASKYNVTASHYMGGSGFSAMHGVLHSSEIPKSSIVVYMFTGDAYWGYSQDEMASNYTQLYHIIKNRGMIPVACIPIMQNRSDVNKKIIPVSVQKERISYLEKFLESDNIPFIRMYDTIDLVPGNGLPDAANMSLLPDGAHPNKDGQIKMGEYLARELPQILKIEKEAGRPRYLPPLVPPPVQ
jgi:hypothetical protein